MITLCRKNERKIRRSEKEMTSLDQGAHRKIRIRRQTKRSSRVSWREIIICLRPQVRILKICVWTYNYRIKCTHIDVTWRHRLKMLLFQAQLFLTPTPTTQCRCWGYRWRNIRQCRQECKWWEYQCRGIRDHRCWEGQWGGINLRVEVEDTFHDVTRTLTHWPTRIYTTRNITSTLRI